MIVWHARNDGKEAHALQSVRRDPPASKGMGNLSGRGALFKPDGQEGDFAAEFPKI